MDQEWTVEQVSQEPPREWNNPKGGVIYYKKVMLKGHPKPVSVGKKSPDALQVGGTVYGHILADMSNSEDKFKAGQNPNFGGGQQASFGGSSSGASKPSYQPKDEHAIAKAVALKAAVDYLSPYAKPGQPQGTSVYLEAADQFLTWLEAGKGSSESTDPKAQANPTTSQSAFKDNDAEAASLYQSIASNEGLDEFGQPEINPQDIPF